MSSPGVEYRARHFRAKKRILRVWGLGFGACRLGLRVRDLGIIGLKAL